MLTTVHELQERIGRHDTALRPQPHLAAPIGAASTQRYIGPGGPHRRAAPDYRALTDAELAVSAPHDSRAFEEIYLRYGDRLHDFCLGMLRDPHAAADCVHDAFVTAATRLGQLREHDKLRPWLYAIARHEALGRLRRGTRERPTDDVPDHVSTDLPPEALAARLELGELVASASGGLSDRERTVLELHYRHGLDGPELADALGVSSTNANTLVSRLRTTVKRCLGALLVARHQGGSCPDLAAVLEGWDGTLTVLMRKRIARHIDGCPTCEQAQDDLVNPRSLLAAAPLFIPAPIDLRHHLVSHVAPLLTPSSSPAAGPSGPGSGADPTFSASTPSPGVSTSSATRAPGTAPAALSGGMAGGSSWWPPGMERRARRRSALAAALLLAVGATTAATLVRDDSARVAAADSTIAAPRGPNAPGVPVTAPPRTAAPIVVPSGTVAPVLDVALSEAVDAPTPGRGTRAVVEDAAAPVAPPRSVSQFEARVDDPAESSQGRHRRLEDVSEPTSDDQTDRDGPRHSRNRIVAPAPAPDPDPDDKDENDRCRATGSGESAVVFGETQHGGSETDGPGAGSGNTGEKGQTGNGQTGSGQKGDGHQSSGDHGWKGDRDVQDKGRDDSPTCR